MAVSPNTVQDFFLNTVLVPVGNNKLLYFFSNIGHHQGAK